MKARTRLAALTVVAMGISGLAGAGPATAAPPLGHVCSGTLSSPDLLEGTYAFLSMPAGSICVIFTPVTIQHPITLGDSSMLGVFDGSLIVNGAVAVGPNAIFGDAYGNAPITVNGPVTVQHNGALVTGFENPYAPLASIINGPVSATDASAVWIHNTRVNGPISLRGGGGSNAVLDAIVGADSGYNFSDLEDNVISGPVSIVGYGGIWAGVIRNQISGGLTFTGNTSLTEFDIGSNTIKGKANCSGNDPAVNTGGSPGSPNVVSAHFNTCG
jgi:hypothetical protein